MRRSGARRGAIWAAAIGAAAMLGGVFTASAAMANVTYAYDTLGRLLTATYDNGVTITYSYDAAGNRTSKTSSGGKVVVIVLGGAFYVIPAR